MAKYVAGARLREAVDRLGSSRARSRVNEFLIIKRGLFLDPSNRLTLGLNDPYCHQAISEMMLCVPDGIDFVSVPGVKSPLINVFGWRTKQSKGYVGSRYYSNGVNSTISGGPWGQIVDIVGNRPRVIVLKSGYLENLEQVLLVRDKKLAKPRLDDVAMWFFRGTDVSGLIGDSEDAATVSGRLVAAFRTELEILDQEASAVFEDDSDAHARAGLDDTAGI